MKEEDVRPGMLVKTNGAVYLMTPDDARQNMGVKASMVDFREKNTYGVVLLSIPGFYTYCGWVVEHVVSGEGAVYYHWEFDPADIDDLSWLQRSEVRRIVSKVEKKAAKAGRRKYEQN